MAGSSELGVGAELGVSSASTSFLTDAVPVNVDDFDQLKALFDDDPLAIGEFVGYEPMQSHSVISEGIQLEGVGSGSVSWAMMGCEPVPHQGPLAEPESRPSKLFTPFFFLFVL